METSKIKLKVLAPIELRFKMTHNCLNLKSISAKFLIIIEISRHNIIFYLYKVGCERKTKIF